MRFVTAPAAETTPRCIACACGGPATGTIEADLLGGAVHISIGVCDRHAPRSEAEAMAAITALLAGIARAGAQINEAGARPAQRGGGHA